MHLTNDSIQGKNDTYQKSDGGGVCNKFSWAEFGDYLKLKGFVAGGEDLIPKIQELVKMSALAVKEKMNASHRKLGFEMMGYDFMLDENLKPFLIECNSNPCLEQPCPLLERLIGNVIESTFEIAVDPYHKPPKTLTNKGKEAVEEIGRLMEENQYVQLL